MTDDPAYPESWEIVELLEIASSIKGKKPKRLGEKSEEFSIPYINIKAFEKKIFRKYTDGENAQLCEKSDILIVWDGARSGLVGTDAKGAIGSTLAKINNFGLNSKYLFHFLRSKFNFINSNPRGVGIPHVDPNLFWSMKIPVAPLNEQTRIVGRIEELFSRLDAGVRSLQAAQTQLEQYRQTTLKQAYTGKLTEEWRQKNPITIELETENIDIESYRNLITWNIPTEWKWTSLGSLMESMKNGIYKPKKFYSNDGIACLRMYNINNGKIVWKDIKRMILTEDEFNKFLLKPDDILINRVNSRELVGKSAVIPSNLEPSVYESKNIRMRINQDTVSSHYIQYWMHFFSSRYFNLNAQQVVGMASINQTQISNMPIPMTTMKEQEKIVEIINNINLYLDKIGQTISKTSLLATHLKNSILQKAYEGLLVPQDPNDEPARLLLERIKVQKVNQRKLM